MHSRLNRIIKNKREKVNALSCFSVAFFSAKGQTLIEILIAISLAMVVLTAMSVAVTTGLSNATLSKNQNLATEYAQEGMELIKQMQLADYSTLTTLSGRYCLAQTCSALSSSQNGCWVNAAGNNAPCPTNISNFFIRQVDISQNTVGCPNTLQATIYVLWSDAKCQAGSACHSEQLISCFSNPNPISAP